MVALGSSAIKLKIVLSVFSSLFGSPFSLLLKSLDSYIPYTAKIPLPDSCCLEGSFSLVKVKQSTCEGKKYFREGVRCLLFSRTARIGISQSLSSYLEG